MSVTAFRVTPVLVSVRLFLGLVANVSAQGSRNARVIAQKANLREPPSALGLAEGEVSEGTIVKILDEKLPWYVVRVGDRVGWMHGATLQFVSAEDVDAQTAPVRLSTTPTPASTVPIPKVRQTAPAQSERGAGYIRGPRGGGCYYMSGSGRKERHEAAAVRLLARISCACSD